MARNYFGTDGIRGRVGEDLITPERVLKLGWAAGRVLGRGQGGQVLIGKDTRISGYMLESALEAGLSAAGLDVLLLGPMPTPGIAYLTRTFHAQAGIVVSASHNPFHDNGIKFFAGDGYKLPDAVEEAIESEMERPLTTVDSACLGKAARIVEGRGRYIEFCKGSIPGAMNLHGLKIVLDCAHGATYPIAPHVFDELGADVDAIGVEPNGLNINDAIGSTQPEAMRRKVLEVGADVGIAFDGDGDRLIMCDAGGNLLDGDEILYIIARARKAAGKFRGAVVGTLMTNLGLEHALAREQIALERTAVGDRYILERLRERDWIIGGEPSGHVICLDRTTTGDGIISGLQVLAEMCKSGQPLSKLRQGVARYPQKLVNVRIADRDAVMGSPVIGAAVAEVERELNGRGRVLLRPSGTEPLIRVMVEGDDGMLVGRLAEQLAARVRDFAAGTV